MGEERPGLETIQDALREHDERSGTPATGTGGPGAGADPDDPVRATLCERREAAPARAGRDEG